jgi:hypothetical protein
MSVEHSPKGGLRDSLAPSVMGGFGNKVSSVNQEIDPNHKPSQHVLIVDF